MKITLQILSLILATYALPMLTSLLLDIPWITAEWTRVALVYLFMLMQFLIGLLALREYFPKKKKD